MTDARRCGSYVLLDPIGSGGMGEVWRARHEMMGRLAAVKLIRKEILGGGSETAAAALRRFQREVQATSALRSPHTVAIYDYGMTDDGTFYYAMELLEGLNLRALVEQHGPLPPERATRFLLDACDSLAEAHHQGLVHRDVKPANLFACRLGLQHDFVKVLDFGLVKATAGSGMLETQLTAGTAALGSPAFMPPEVAEGHPTIDARSDVYSLGCVAFWLLTGRLVFEADSAVRMLMDHVGKEPDPPSRRGPAPLPRLLDEAVLACLRKKPADRPQDARQLAALLRRLHFEQPWTDERADAWWHEHPLPAPATPSFAPASSPVARPSQRPMANGQEPPPARPVAKKVLLERRDKTIAALQEQFVQSHIDAGELSRRIELAERAPAPDDLDRLLADLPLLPGEEAIVPAKSAPPAAPATAAIAPSTPAAASPLEGAALAPVEIPVEPSRTFVAVFGGKVRSGKWYPPRKLRTVSVFGGTELDFRHAEFQPGVTTVQVVAAFGGCEIVVPTGMYVDVDGVGIFGGFDEQASTAGPPPQGGRPWLRVRGVALFGGVDVKVADKDADVRKLFGPGPRARGLLPPERMERVRRLRRRDRE
jgi:serine/threonine protein kinase